MANENYYQVVVVATAIVVEKKVLILRRAANEAVYPNYWELPSGKLEGLEQPHDTAHRETQEETGLLVHLDGLLPPFAYTVRKPGGLVRHTVQITYLAHLSVDSGRYLVELSPEHQEYDWVRLQDLADYTMSAETKQLVKAALRA